MLRFEHILVATYGRAGSTLLQGVLNSIDGVLVRGENHHAFHGLFTAFQQLKRTRDAYPEASDPTHAWFGAAEIDPDRFARDAGRLMRQVIRGKRQGYRCLGFKEIRYADTVGENPAYLQFLRMALPRCAVIVGTRDLNAVLASAWWRRMDRTEAFATLKSVHDELSNYASQNPDHAFRIDYGDLIGNGAAVREMFEFLGAPYDAHAVADVLRVRHSRQRGPRLNFEPYVKVVYPSRSARLSVGKIYRAPRAVVAGEAFTISGRALSADPDDPIVEVYCEAGCQIDPVECGLSSPNLGRDHPGRPDAARARFRLSSIATTRSMAIRVCARLRSGLEETVATIKIVSIPGDEAIS